MTTFTTTKSIKRLALLAMLCIITLLILPVQSWAAEPKIHASAAVLIDMKTGQVLWSKNETEALPPASLTKIITAITALDNATPEQLCQISAHVKGIPETNIDLREGESFTLFELLLGALLPSGNDATYAIAENVAGSEALFVYLMNLKAWSLGSVSANLYNTNGLPDDRHLISALDIAQISRYAMSNDVFAEIVSTKYAKIGSGSSLRQLKNTNKLLFMDPLITGIKTGTTNKAGQCLVSAKSKDGMEVLSVVLHSPDRYGESQKLLDYGLKEFIPVDFIKASEVLASIPITGGKAPTVAISAMNDGYFLCKKDKLSLLSMKWELPPSLTAPLKQGEPVGRLLFVDDEETVWGVVNLQAAEAVDKKLFGLFGK